MTNVVYRLGRALGEAKRHRLMNGTAWHYRSALEDPAGAARSWFTDNTDLPSPPPLTGSEKAEPMAAYGGGGPNYSAGPFWAWLGPKLVYRGLHPRVWCWGPELRRRRIDLNGRRRLEFYLRSALVGPASATGVETVRQTAGGLAMPLYTVAALPAAQQCPRTIIMDAPT